MNKKTLLTVAGAALVIILVLLLLNVLPRNPSQSGTEPAGSDPLTPMTNAPKQDAPNGPAARPEPAETEPAGPEESDASPTGLLTVHFLNVEQGDCIFLELPDGKTTLIDCGERDYSSSVISRLYALGCTRIDYLFATHPHSDHIGGMRDIIPCFDVGALYLPDVSTTTNSYVKMLEAAADQKIPTVLASAGMSFSPCDGVEYQILAPIGDKHDGLNNWSIVLRVVYGETAFLFCGDAELESVEQILDSGAELTADVLKLGHHGSSDGLTREYFEKISPSYAVACCAEVNDYGHPHREVVQMTKNAGVPLFCTYEGSITFASDGSQVYYIADADLSEPDPAAAPYIGNRNSKKFHTADCDGLPNENNRVYFEDRQTALDAGYSPCPSCNP